MFTNVHEFRKSVLHGTIIIDAEKPIANVKTVTAQESLKCDKCEKTFFWPAELKLHIDSQHYQQASSSENDDLILGY